MTMFFTIPSIDAIALTVIPSSSSKMMRARSTFACDDFRFAIILFNFTFSSSVKISVVHLRDLQNPLKQAELVAGTAKKENNLPGVIK